jgi:uncharacterized protein (TIGR03083 family)
MTAATLADYRDAHGELFAHYRELCTRLDDAELATRSLCPAWDVRQVIQHTIGVEHWLTGWEPSTEAPPPLERMGEWQERTTPLDRGAFAEAVSATTEQRLAELSSMAPDVLERPSFTPAGVATYGRFLQVRLFDLWVHANDIALPLGETVGDDGFAARAALQEVDDSIGYIVGKKIGLPDGASIVFRIGGVAPRDIAVAVTGKAARVPEAADPTVTVSADLTTFVLLAAGRVDPQERIDAGAITWTGDAEWGERAARNLAYTR